MVLNINTENKKFIVEVICLLYILLFAYAAVSKILDFENFQVQIGQSPLLSAFAQWISWMVPAVEIITAILLVFRGYRIVGLYMALSIMMMFTSYIFIVINFSSFIPCSCGGILEKMSWNVHLIFNIIFVLLAVLALWMIKENPADKRSNNLSFYRYISSVILLSTALIIFLHLFSEDTMHHRNPFIRRFPQHPVMLYKTINLKFNSFYFAGQSEGKIYLGNNTDPLHVLKIDEKKLDLEKKEIFLDRQDMHYRRAKLAVLKTNFYLMDGTIPFVFKGNVKDWKIIKEFNNVPYFTIAEPIDSTKIAVRSTIGKDASHKIGIYRSGKIPKTNYNPKLLNMQKEGIFSTDGMMIYNHDIRCMIYIYYYRNEYFAVDNDGAISFIANTIDTIKNAKINVAYLKNNTERKMSSPPFTVNAHAAVLKNLLFVHSKVPGRFEDEELWKQAFIIDVYNLKKRTYLLSFTLYKIQNKKLRSFLVTDTHLFAIMDDELAVFDIRANLEKEITSE